MEASRVVLGDFSLGRAGASDVHKAVCLDIIRHVRSTRASVWYFSPFHDRITCACQYDVRTGAFEQGVELQEDDFPEYFAAIRANSIVNAPDAQRHPATRCFEELYFAPNSIMSLLDVIITTGRQHVAVLCCEHCDEVRHWQAIDEEYLRQMAILLRLSFLVAQRPLSTQVA
jgi:GAF domain-containing protein